MAQQPLEDRAAARLLWVHQGKVLHRQFRDILTILNEGDVLVLNDTRVTALRLLGERASGGKVEALLLRQEAEDTFLAMVRPSKKLKVGSIIDFGNSLV
ncbi:MAG TPA: S-adenosylmethionine:tRNA ribosyltransferase-isomerase, partial [Fimbriimonadaceae bacterium]|nr:S-adenosylmethionine:tRNA ribosyltransferase-isomerase [Fimbriimonadaceae bacterium]